MKIKNELLKFVVVLGIVTFSAATILSFTYNITKGPIEEAARQDFLSALNIVLPSFDNDPLEDALNLDDGAIIYIAKKDGEVLGYAVQGRSTKGYSGEIVVLVGADSFGEIYAVQIVSHAETPGLGDKIEKSDFLDNFKSISIDSNISIKADGGDIDQFSGATISPRAVCEAINNANSVLAKVVNR